MIVSRNPIKSLRNDLLKKILQFNIGNIFDTDYNVINTFFIN